MGEGVGESVDARTCVSLGARDWVELELWLE